jgi:hypothetical protein
MSNLLFSLLKLSSVPLRFGLIAADAAWSFGRSIAVLETPSSKPVRRFTDEEIDAAARVIKVSMISGRDLTFQNLLQINFPEDTIRAMAEGALIAARDARLNARTASGIGRSQCLPNSEWSS